MGSAYDDVYIAAECLKQTGDDQDADGFRDCMYGITWSGAIGQGYSFDSNGEVVGLSRVIVEVLRWPSGRRTTGATSSWPRAETVTEVELLTLRDNRTALLAVALTALAALYVGWKVILWPEQALQFHLQRPVRRGGVRHSRRRFYNSVQHGMVLRPVLWRGGGAGRVRRLLPALARLARRAYDVTDPIINAIFAVVVAGVVAWLLHETLLSRLRNRLGRSGPAGSLIVEGALAVAAGGYAWIVLSFPQHLHLTLSPAAGALVAVAVVWATHRAYRGIFHNAGSALPLAVGAVVGVALGAYIGLLLSGRARRQALSQAGSFRA